MKLVLFVLFALAAITGAAAMMSLPIKAFAGEAGVPVDR
jgi:hypothetical protein